MDYVVVDVSNLMSRLFYGAHGAGSWMDRVGAALVGFPANLDRLSARFGTPNLVFAFDAPPYKRTGLNPDYKSGRETVDDDEKGEALVTLKRATARLGKEVLNAVGFTNIYARAGYEADDVMAAVRDGLRGGDRAILVTSDRDAYQLLDRRCAVYEPVNDRFITANTFRAEYGIEPAQWPDVKALVGGKDGLTGCPGVAEATAVKYVRREIPKHYAVRDRIAEFVFRGAHDDNLQLCKLPFPGLGPITPDPVTRPDAAAWAKYYAAFGLPAPADPRRAART